MTTRLTTSVSFATCLGVFYCLSAAAQETLELTDRMHHLRAGEGREWSEFPPEPESTRWTARFDSPASDTWRTLRIRQQDVKQSWQVRLNNVPIGTLERDENDMVLYFDLSARDLKPTGNELVIDSNRPRAADDIRIGEVRLSKRTRAEVLGECLVQVQVTEHNSPVPARITVVNDAGALQSVGIRGGSREPSPLAVRAGTIYTANGEVQFGLPAGEYTIYAGRGFEYSLASQRLELQAGSQRKLQLQIAREVPTQGYVACDTHVHTRTHSGHGDATVQERMVTIAAEGIELPIATDHNVHIDHHPFAVESGVRKYFTPVIGNEVTTPVAHFNCFPIAADSPIPAHRFEDLSQIYNAVYSTPGVRAVILNHSRDVHSGVTPFGPRLHLGVAGVPLNDADDRPRLIRFNAMEVINSGATQTDAMQLLRDWMALLNRGHRITPVGSSDSHDVARHFVGQGRTYIRCDDSDPGDIDIAFATDQFVGGAVIVSYGLAAEIIVNGKYRSGDRAMASGDTTLIEARVLGPHWVRANVVELYANGQLIRTENLSESQTRPATGVIWKGTWELATPSHDVFYTVVTRGPGERRPFWAAAKPYQPDGPDWIPTFWGCSGAVYLDADRNGTWQSARDYALRVVNGADNDFARTIASLQAYDSAVSTQAAHLLQARGGRLLTAQTREQFQDAADHVKQGIMDYLEALRESALAEGRVTELSE